MKTKHLPVILVMSFISTHIHAQAKTYILNSEYTKEKLKLASQIASLQPIIKSEFNKTVTNKKTKTTAAYRQLERVQNQLSKDSIALENSCQKEIDIFNSINKINALIEKFSSSNQSFDIKKKYLIEAQKLVLNSGKNYLVYADATINSGQQSKFMVLKSNALDLKVHLKRIVWDIKKNNTNPTAIVPQEINEQLASLRKQMASTKRYETTITTSTKPSSSKLIISNIKTNINTVSGTFKKQDDFAIMARDYGSVYKNQLIKKEDLEKLRIPNSHVRLLQNEIIIVNTLTGALYFADQRLLDQVDYNQKKIVKLVHNVKEDTVKTKPIESYKQISNIINSSSTNEVNNTDY